MTERTPFDEPMSTDELSRVRQELVCVQDELQHHRQKLTALHHLIDALTCSADEDTIIKALTKRLPTLVNADLVGVVRSHRHQAWIWSDSQNRDQEARARRYLLHRLGHLSSHGAESHSPLRGIRGRHLYLVPPATSEPSLHEQDFTCGHEVALALGANETGLLLIQPKGSDHFSHNEREVLETIGASLSLALRHADMFRRTGDLALRDPLTELLNAHAFEGALRRELSVGHRYGVPACLLLLDLDFFTVVNDRLGHMAGDHVLKTTADLIRATVRDSDIVGRVRDNTFGVVLPHTDRQQAHILAERMRDRIERYLFAVGTGQVRTTASIGLAAVPDTAVATVAEWMVVGDAALNAAKVLGRNCVILHAPKPPGLACAVALSCAA